MSRQVYLIIAVALSLIGCKAAVIEAPQAEMPAPEPVCFPPFMESADGCCLDEDADGRCDAKEEPAPPVSHYDASITCKRSALDGYISCTRAFLPRLTYRNPTSGRMDVSVGFSAYNKSAISLPLIEKRMVQAQSLEGKPTLGFTEMVGPGCSEELADADGRCTTSSSYVLSLAVDVARRNQAYDTTESLGVRVCTRLRDSQPVCEDIVYSIEIGMLEYD